MGGGSTGPETTPSLPLMTVPVGQPDGMACSRVIAAVTFGFVDPVEGGGEIQLEMSELDFRRWQDDPRMLDSLLSRARTEGIRGNQNELETLVTVCLYEIQREDDPERRRWFRDGAIGILELGRSQGIASEARYVERMIYVRMTYLRHSDCELEWFQLEMTRIVDIFEDWLPFGIETAREITTRWRAHQDAELVPQLLPLRRIKTYVMLIEPGAGYLAGAKAERMREWLDLRPQLP